MGTFLLWQYMMEGRRFGDEASILVLEGIDPHGNPGVREELPVLQEPEGEPIRADHQLGGRKQDLQGFCRRRGELGRPLVTLGEAHGEKPQRDQAADAQRRHHRDRSLPLTSHVALGTPLACAASRCVPVRRDRAASPSDPCGTRPRHSAVPHPSQARVRRQQLRV